MTSKSDTRARLIEASLSVMSQKGYRGATTREIAERADVSEVTLFRHFGSKANLAEAALEHATESFRGGAAAATGDLRLDLIDLASGYVAFIDRWPELADRVFPELSSDPELGSGAIRVLERNAAAVSQLLNRHHESLAGATIEDMIRAFLGPLMARATLRRVLGVDPFDATAYVDRFLDGHRG